MFRKKSLWMGIRKVIEQINVNALAVGEKMRILSSD